MWINPVCSGLFLLFNALVIECLSLTYQRQDRVVKRESVMEHGTWAILDTSSTIARWTAADREYVASGAVNAFDSRGDAIGPIPGSGRFEPSQEEGQSVLDEQSYEGPITGTGTYDFENGEIYAVGTVSGDGWGPIHVTGIWTPTKEASKMLSQKAFAMNLGGGWTEIDEVVEP